MRIENNAVDVRYYSNNQHTGQNRTEASPEVMTKDLSEKTLKIKNVENVATPEERKAANEHEVISAIEKANKHIRIYDRKLEFSIHDATKQIIVKVINTDDDTVIREIPSEKILDMVAHLWEVAGIMIDKKL